MAKKRRPYYNPRTTQVFEDLEDYLNFCRKFGYVYNPAEMYDFRSYNYRQFDKFMKGKAPHDHWASLIADARMTDRRNAQRKTTQRDSRNRPRSDNSNRLGNNRPAQNTRSKPGNNQGRKFTPKPKPPEQTFFDEY